MTELNNTIAGTWMPPRIKRLPISPSGFPVPWFVAWQDGVPDFRVIGPGKIAAAHNKKLCWVCGEPRGVHLCFPIGPMCSINRTIAEPPSHYDCARFSAMACPFLSKPRMRRNEKDLPTDHKLPAGEMIKRNPGVTCLWITRSYKPFRVGNGVLFRIGEPERVEWWAEGRPATRDEVLASIDSGYPLLMEIAAKEGPDAIKALGEYRDRAMPLLPAESA